MNSLSDELYHYGVLGMKWGVRRSQEELDRKAGRYKERELAKANKFYSKKINRSRIKRDKLIEYGKDPTSINSKIAQLETDKVAINEYFRNFDYSKYRKDKRELGKKYVSNFLKTVGLADPSYLINTKRKYRVDDITKKNISKEQQYVEYYLNLNDQLKWDARRRGSKY